MAAKSVAEWEQILGDYSDDDDDDKPDGALFNNVELLSQLASIVPKENVPEELKPSHEDLISRLRSAEKTPISSESSEAQTDCASSNRTETSSSSATK